jgi:hypothetical protein
LATGKNNAKYEPGGHKLAKNINNKKRFIIFLAVLLAGVISGTAAFSFYYGNNDNGTG